VGLLLKQASFIQHAQGALQTPETRRILAGAALGGVAGDLSGAQERHGRLSSLIERLSE